jgi:hypothetical protein
VQLLVLSKIMISLLFTFRSCIHMLTLVNSCSYFWVYFLSGNIQYALYLSWYCNIILIWSVVLCFSTCQLINVRQVVISLCNNLYLFSICSVVKMLLKLLIFGHELVRCSLYFVVAAIIFYFRDVWT